MKKKSILVFAMLLILVTMYSVSPTVVTAHSHDHGHGSAESNCHEPTSHLVTAATEDIGFNATEFTVDKDECVMIMFINAQDAEHDFALEHPNGTEYFGLHIVGNGTMQMKSISVRMPNQDTILPFYCTVEDHRDAHGMEGQIIVGEGLTEGEERTPGFGFIIAFASIMAIQAFRMRRKK